jgi:release factor glutamine methyltransferase
MNQEGRWLLQEKFKGMESEAFQADLLLLQSGTPLAYLIGSIPFLNCTIFLDSHPLIPRTETEFWTEKAIRDISRYTGKACVSGYVKVLDLCAGSGAIGAAVAQSVPEAHVTFGEIEQRHFSTIGKNLEVNKVPCTRYKVFHSDLFENISGTFDFILTNPPYIDPAIDRAEPSVKLHEPSLALYGGANGMECIEKIIKQATAYLSEDGQLWIEHEPEQCIAIQKLAKTHNFACTTHQDQYGIERYTILVLQ